MTSTSGRSTSSSRPTTAASSRCARTCGYSCPDPTDARVGDILLSLDWPLGPGPRLTPTGGFKLLVTQAKNILSGKMFRLPIPVQVNGALGAGGGSGRFNLSKGNCSGKGLWQTRRTYKI